MTSNGLEVEALAPALALALQCGYGIGENYGVMRACPFGQPQGKSAMPHIARAQCVHNLGGKSGHMAWASFIMDEDAVWAVGGAYPAA